MDASETNKLWRPRWYYILRNKTSGKLYAGQTVQDIKAYLGSGVYWGKHCVAHGGYVRSNIETVEAVWIEQRADAQAWLDALDARDPDYWKGGSGKRWANQVQETTEDSAFLGRSTWVHKETGAVLLYPKGECPGNEWENFGVRSGKISGKRNAELGIGCHAQKHLGKGGKKTAELGIAIFAPGTSSKGGKIGGKKNFELGTGIFAPEHRGKGGKVAGKINGKRLAELGLGCFAPEHRGKGGKIGGKIGAARLNALRWPMTYLAIELGCPKSIGYKGGPLSTAHIEQWLSTSPRAEEFRARWAVMEAEIRSKF